MMLWLIILLMLCALALLVAAGGMTLHVLRQRVRAKQPLEDGTAVESGESN